MDAVSNETITVSNVAIGFTAGLLATTPIPLMVYFSVEDAGVAGMRYWVDGTDPTAALGHLLHDEDSITLTGLSDLANFRAIRVGAVDITLQVTYFA